MAKFDFIEASVHGYRFLWTQRITIARMAMPLLLIKIGTFLAILLMGYEEEYLRQGLILLPVSFAEGWLLALLIRMAMFREQPFTKNHEHSKKAHNALLTSAIIYTLIKLVSGAAAAFIMTQGLHLSEPAANPENTASITTFFASLLAIGGIIWAFRLIWLYVPAAMDIPAIDFLKRLGPLSSSFPLIGIWLICTLPIMAITILGFQIIAAIIPIQEIFPETGQRIIILIGQAITEIAVSITATIAIAYATYDLIYPQKK